jgi:hypothetical protein
MPLLKAPRGAVGITELRGRLRQALGRRGSYFGLRSFGDKAIDHETTESAIIFRGSYMPARGCSRPIARTIGPRVP